MWDVGQGVLMKEQEHVNNVGGGEGEQSIF